MGPFGPLHPPPVGWAPPTTTVDPANLLPWITEPVWLPRPLAPPDTVDRRTGPLWLIGDGNTNDSRLRPLGAHLDAAGWNVATIPAADAGRDASLVSPREIVFLSPIQRSNQSATALLSTLQRLLRCARDYPSPVTVRVITAGAHAVRGVSDVTHPSSAALWGFLKVAAIELPNVRCQAIDVDSAEGWMEQVARELLTDASDPEAAYRGGERFVPAARPVSPGFEAPSSVLKPGGAYLITGGSGGIGQVLARWLLEHWAARVALISRRPPPMDLDAGPERFLPLAADVRDVAAIRSAVGSVRARFGPLDAVFHLAGTIRKSRLADATETEMAAILAPKVEGTLVLDEVLGEVGTPLILFSSVAGLRGNVFQADYSAASRFLDSFAAWRTARGRRTVSLDWGLWDEVGMGAEHARALRERGEPVIAPTEGLAALELALRLPGHHYLIEPPRVVPVPVARDGSVSSEPRAIERELQATLGEVLGTSGAAFSPRASFVDLGVDSILALKWVKQLEARLGLALPATLPFDYPNLESLSAHLRSRIGTRSDASRPTIEWTAGLRLTSGRQLIRYQPKG